MFLWRQRSSSSERRGLLGLPVPRTEADAEGLGRWGGCVNQEPESSKLQTSAGCLKRVVVTLLVISGECGLLFARFPEFSREAKNILKSWQVIQIFDKYGVSPTKYVLRLNLADVLFVYTLCYI